MQQETKTCQNCKERFTIEPEDFKFYEKIKVPPPTFCPECRLQRRLMIRNERALYKRPCDLCGKSVIAIFSPENPHKMYCESCWWSDKWGAGEYAQDYDPSRGFFEQFQELKLKVPFPALVNDYLFNTGSEYVNHTGYLKNCYLIFNADNCENVLYSSTMTKVKDSMDVLGLMESELCYQDISCFKCYQTFFSEDCNDCVDVYFSKNLGNCQNCFGCANLKNKKYHFFNEPLSKEDYEKKIKDYTLDSFKAIQKIKDEIYGFWKKYPVKFMHGRMNQNVSGDYVFESKNAHYCWLAKFVEDGKYCQWVTLPPCKDVMDYTEWGDGAELCYETVTVGQGANNVKFCFACWMTNSINVEYSMFTRSSQNMFGCVGMYKKENCILNKKYSKEEFETLRSQIIADMNENPYVDQKGRVWKYGEFFPYDLVLFSYNETSASDIFPFSKDKIMDSGFKYYERPQSEYEITLPAGKIPDSINDIDDSILNEVLGCSNCGHAFKLVKAELDLLKRFGFPIPRTCYECRFKERWARINPPRFYQRACQCAGITSDPQPTTNHKYKNIGLSHPSHKDGKHCPNEFETSYLPQRPEIIYCEQCYQSEVV